MLLYIKIVLIQQMVKIIDHLLYHCKEEIHSERVNYLLTAVVQSNKYHKSHTVGVTSEVGLTTDRDLSVLPMPKKHNVFYSLEIPEVMWYKPLYNISPQKEFFYYVL